MKIRLIPLGVLFVCLLFMPQGVAQIPTRIIVNPGFEFPATGCSPASYCFIPHSGVKGWRTLDSIPAPIVSCGTSGSNAPYLIEIWNDGFLSRSAHSGGQLAEINASQATFLYQEICLMPNESVPFSVWHLRRANSGSSEQMVAELKTAGNVNIATASTHTANGSWTNYTGTLTNDTNAGVRRYGFRAVSGGSLGNLIDDVSIALKPLVDIKSFTHSLIYESDSNTLDVYVNGTLLGAATVTIARSGTATYLSDFTIGTASRGTITKNSNGDITLTLPAGDYDPNESTGSTAGLISIKFNILGDGVTESGETIEYTITGSSNGGAGNTAYDLSTGINGKSASCGVTVGASQFTILDITALPARIIDFKANRLVGINEVTWQVANENEVDRYILEYSADGTNYIAIAEILYNASGSGSYAFAHRLPSGINACYRLKVSDRQGRASTLDNPVCLERDIQSTFSVYPNPNNGHFTAGFFSPAEKETSILLRDICGKLVYAEQFISKAGENTLEIHTDELQEGVYFITYMFGEVSSTLKVHISR